MLNKRLMALAILLVGLLAVSAVSAEDNAAEDIGSVDDEIEEVSSLGNGETDIVNVEEDQVLEKNNDGTFTDLANEIAKAGNQLNLTKNYSYSSDDLEYLNGIVIDREITINGGGFVINGNNNASAFNISSDNVILRDIEFSNCYVFNSCYGNGVNFSSSNCSSYAGAINWNGNNGCLSNCSFVNCHSFSNSQSSSSSADYGVISSYSYSYSYGGAVYWKGNNSSLSDCRFINCSSVSLSYSSSCSDAISQWNVSVNAYSYSYSYGGAVYLQGDNANISDCSFIDSLASSPAFINCTGFGQFYSNYEREGCSNGGAIYLKGDNAVLENCVFVNSSVVSSDIDLRSSGGGAVYWNGVNGNLHDCIFANSSSCYDGGAVEWTGGDGILSDCSFVNSYAAENGGAVYLWRVGNHVLSNCSFVNSSCDWQGGAVWGGEGNLHNCSFENSRARISSAAIFWDGTGEVYDCSFTNSTAAEYAGAVFLRNGILHDCTFVDSSSEGYGGAVYMWDNAVLYDCSFVNSSANEGGTIYWEIYFSGSRGVLANCSFVNSYAENDGGAIIWSVYEGNNAVLANCSFSNTSSKGEGSAIYTWDVSKYAVASLYGCSFDGDYYNYEDYCSGNYKFKPVLSIDDYNTAEGDKAIVFSSQPLRYDCTARIYSLDDESFDESFIFSSRESLSKEFVFNNLTFGAYGVSLSYSGDDLYSKGTAAATVNVLRVVRINVAPITYVIYNGAGKLVVNLADSRGNAIANEIVNVNINNKITPIKTDGNGQATMPIGLAPGSYTATVTYADAKATAKITVKKATVKMTAKAKTFKKSVKTKKYTITLKNNLNKAMKSTKVTLKVNKKTYTVKTSSKGVATFKITKLTKKGKYTATVTYNGNAYYNKLTKKVKITVK